MNYRLVVWLVVLVSRVYTQKVNNRKSTGRFNYSIDCTNMWAFLNVDVVIPDPKQNPPTRFVPWKLYVENFKLYVKKEMEMPCNYYFNENPKTLVLNNRPGDQYMYQIGGYEYTAYDQKSVVSASKRLRTCCENDEKQQGKPLTIPEEVNGAFTCPGCFLGGNRFCSFQIWDVQTMEVMKMGVCRYCAPIDCRTKCPDGKVHLSYS